MKQTTEQIRLGLPRGSLNMPGRGDTRQVFIDAGYDIREYEPGKESRASIINDPEIRLFVTRPQRSPMDLNIKLLDIAITGADWVEEERTNGRERYDIRKIGDLEYGQTTLVIAVSERRGYGTLSDLFMDLKGRTEENPILCYTEYVNLAARAFMQDEAFRKYFGKRPPFVRSRGMIRPGNLRVRILGSEGATEESIAMGADVIVDNSQSGQSLIDNHLLTIGEIMKSSAGLYAGLSCEDWKERKAQEIFRKLYGAVVAKRYLEVKFNIPIGNVGKVREFLVQKGLCGNEPSILVGENYAQVDTLTPKSIFPSIEEVLKVDFEATYLISNPITQLIR